MSAFNSISGQILWQWLPEIYRSKDQNEEFQDLVDSYGAMLDLVRATLNQRLADNFPDNPLEDKQRACQDWLLPYFAKLLDARLVSPHVEGRRDEVAKAVYWRQRKGTLIGIEDIAQRISQKEMIVHEGFQRVATTPRINIPRLDPKALGYLEKSQLHDDPLSQAKNPVLPAVTVDFRSSCRALSSDIPIPGWQLARFEGQDKYWRFSDPHGRPCFTDTYEDASKRTVDLRDPNWKHGWYHPKRILLFTAPELGFFVKDQIEINWGDRADYADPPSNPDNLILFQEQSDDDQVVLANPAVQSRYLEDTSRLNFNNSITPKSKYESKKVVRISDMNFLNKLELNVVHLELENVAVKQLVLNKVSGKPLSIKATNCLFDEIIAPQAEVELEYCTVMQDIQASLLKASDCIFVGQFQPKSSNKSKHCVRYSRVNDDADLVKAMLPPNTHNTSDVPVFFEWLICQSDGTQLDSTVFGHPGYGVLHPATPQSITRGAEQGGEMGAFHEQFHRQQIKAIQDKYVDYLPVDVEAVVIEDSRLLQTPPTLQTGA
jgi:hypothetical protein